MSSKKEEIIQHYFSVIEKAESDSLVIIQKIREYYTTNHEFSKENIISIIEEGAIRE
ncbi:hypothetical protein NEF87_004888 [Candidatus Lokiarchaeum ossiferum]|uniref:Uncharacterized protein n=1 Tax=Candidatus Lokiarchaeum ossiferum TaxID=2951803 RepID=A0ABY6HYY0_9ARCH|nr:hypothetical protein NEF87_004888 [Candidatus Lokiarchaeum sp. B-35]